MDNLNDILIIKGLMGLFGVDDPWIIISAILALLVIILLIVAISNGAKKRRFRKELAEAKEYATGLEALQNLPPLKSPEDGEIGDSLVYTSTREMKRIKIDDAEPEGDNLTAQVHNAIYASVTSSLKPTDKEGSDERADLSGRIPHI